MKRWICLLLALLLPIAAACAEEPPVYVALGDSISAGYGLEDMESCFTNIVAAQAGYTLINHAVNGNTAPGILRQLQDPALLADIARAELVTVTCGGNDLMAVMYARVAAVYNANVPENMSVSDREVPGIMISGGDPRQASLMISAMLVLEGHPEMGVIPLMETPEMAQALTLYMEQITEIIGVIRAANPDVTIVLATQYNPYKGFTGLYASLDTAMDAGAQALSAAIRSMSDTLSCHTAEVYAAFAACEDHLMNAAMKPLNLDFHPNAAGHALIARCVLDALQGAE